MTADREKARSFQPAREERLFAVVAEDQELRREVAIALAAQIESHRVDSFSAVTELPAEAAYSLLCVEWSDAAESWLEDNEKVWKGWMAK